MRLSPTDIMDFVGGEHVGSGGRRAESTGAGAVSPSRLPPLTEDWLDRVADALPHSFSTDKRTCSPWPARIHILDRWIGVLVGSFVICVVVNILI